MYSFDELPPSAQLPPLLYYMRTVQSQRQSSIILLTNETVMLQVDFSGSSPRFGLCHDLGMATFIEQDDSSPLLRAHHLATVYGVSSFLALCQQWGISLYARWTLVPQRTDAVEIIKQAYGPQATWFSPGETLYLLGHSQQGQAICLHWQVQGLVTQEIVQYAYQEVCQAKLLVPLVLFSQSPLHWRDTTIMTYRHLSVQNGKVAIG